jgi:DNA topoisomerase VI subunit B
VAESQDIGSLDIKNSGSGTSGEALSVSPVQPTKGAVSSMPVKSKNAAVERAKSTPPVAATQSGNGKSAVVAPPPEALKRAKPTYKGASAQEMSARQRDISVAEFFQKNRHLLGFDNPRKALLTTVKEAVDNSLDACEEAGIMPEVAVKIDVAPNGDGSMPQTPAQAERFIITVSDNGPGIVKKNIGKVFAKLLFGSKFHRLRMSRGQQGIGISAAGMYGQLTTGKPTRVLSKIKGDEAIHSFEISIDTKRNEPVEHETRQFKWVPETGTGVCNEKGVKSIKWASESGTSVSIELAGKYQKGKASVDEYLELCSVANPHVKLSYTPPDATEPIVYPAGVDFLPEQPREIKPHPYGIELGMLLKMMQDTQSHWLSGFLSADFSRVSTKTAEEICSVAKLSPRARPRDIVGKDAEALYRALQTVKLMAPPTDCISPIGEKAILAGLVKAIKGDFYTAATRPPKVYRGNPFVIECGLAFGKGDGSSFKEPAQLAAEELDKKANGVVEAKAEGEEDEDDTELAQVIRFANRVPLLYQQSACATFKAVLKTAWKNYGLTQSRGALPQGPMVIFIHMASVWVPFTSEAKEAIAEYDEIMDEIKRALQECGRKLGIWIRKRQHAKNEFERRNIFQRYIEEVAEACKKLKNGKLDADKLKKQLQKIAEEVTGGEETDEILKKKKAEEEDELENTVILTPQGLKGDINAKAAEAAGHAPAIAASPNVAAAEQPTNELIEGATSKKKKPSSSPVPKKETAKKIAGAGAKPGKSKKKDEPGLF